MKIVFMGTPEYSVATLQALIDSKHEVIAVYTKPDKPKGRGKKMEITPVKELALRHNIPVYQPSTLKEEAAKEQMRSLKADIGVVIAYGLLLPEEVLNAFPRGCMNLHASLLPKFRGASPIQTAILAGEKVTGVTSMQMDVGLDTGDILLKAEYEMDGSETAASLHDTLSKLSAELCIKTLQAMENNEITPMKQPEAGVSYAGKITKEMGEIDWNQSAQKIDCQIRGLNSWPSAYTFLGEKLLKIWQAVPVQSEISEKDGTIVKCDKSSLEVACADGIIRILELQLEGKKKMGVADFLNGQNLSVGEQLGR